MSPLLNSIVSQNVGVGKSRTRKTGVVKDRFGQPARFEATVDKSRTAENDLTQITIDKPGVDKKGRGKSHEIVGFVTEFAVAPSGADERHLAHAGIAEAGFIKGAQAEGTEPAIGVFKAAIDKTGRGKKRSTNREPGKVAIVKKAVLA